MDGIQLVYFYLNHPQIGLNNVELTFSNRFEFKIKEFNEGSRKFKVVIRQKEKTDNISAEFWGEEKHVTRVDLLVGQNGAGKSTIMKYIANNSYDDRGEWFAIYLEIVNGVRNYYFNTDFGKVVPISIEILESWNNESFINLKEIYDVSLNWSYIPNAIDRKLIDYKTSSVYKFVKHQLKILQEHFPAENLAYAFDIPVDFNVTKNLLKDKKVNNYLKRILKKSTSFILRKRMKSELKVMSKEQYGFGEIDEEYIEYIQYRDALLSDSFYLESFSKERLNIFKMMIYMHWVINIIEKDKEIKSLESLSNIESLPEFNIFLINVLKNSISESKNKSNKIQIIGEYIQFGFIERLFFLVEYGIMDIAIKWTGGIDFTFYFNKKINSKAEEYIIDLLDFIDYINTKYNNIKDFNLQRAGLTNMSSGEIAFIDLFSRIYHKFSSKNNKEDNQDDEDEFYDEWSNSASNFLCLLDEPDAAFHPEWSRQLIYNLTSFINNLLSGTDKKCQLIVTTHSPFMVSDMPSDYVTSVKLNLDKNDTYYRTIKKPKYSFAANIYELLNDDFFMDAPVGEFAQRKIQQIIDRIKSLKTLPDESLNKEITDISGFINMISDKLVRARLYDMLNKEKQALPDVGSLNLIEDLIKEIKELKQEVSELKRKSYNGEKL